MEGRRALTIIEVLAATAVLAAVAAVAFPALGGWLERSRLETGLAQLGAAVGAGRALARETGKAVDLVAVDAVASKVTGLSLEEHGKSPVSSESHPEATARLTRTLDALPTGLRIAAAEPEAKDKRPTPSRPSEETATRVVIAVCLPDGLVKGFPGVQLVAGDQKLDLSVARWTGAVSARAVVVKTDGKTEALAEAPPPREGAP